MKNQSYFLLLHIIVISLLLPSCMDSKTKHVDTSFFDIKKLKNTEKIIPIAILGSGPAGLSAAIYGGRAHIDTVVFEGILPGGLLTQTTIVENWPGSIEIMGPDIIKNLKDQAAKWRARFIFDTIESVDFTTWPFALTTADDKQVKALTVIIATGATPRYLGVPGEQEYWGRGVTTCAVCDAPFYKNEEVVVVGGGDSAAEEAMQLAPFAKKITILVRKDYMRASASMQERLKAFDKISVRYNVEVKEIHGNDVQVTGVTLYNNKTKTTELMPISGVFLAIGHLPNTKFLDGAVQLTDHGHIKLFDRTQQTSVPGVFAAGDVADDRYRQAGVSAGHGISAALDATFFLNMIGFNEKIQQRLKDEGRLFKDETELDYQIAQAKTLDEFESLVIDADNPVIVDFYAEWCPTCMQMLPALASVAHDFENKVRFIKVDADGADDILKNYHVQKVPAILVFKDGSIIARFARTMNKKELHEFAQSLIDEVE